MNIYRLALFLLFFYAHICSSHEIGTREYDLGIYKSNSFEYPASLAGEKIEHIVNEIKRISKHKILYVSVREDHLYDVVTCIQGERGLNTCELGNVYIFGQGKQSFSNFSITPSSIKFIKPKNRDGSIVESKEYSKGIYANVPFAYPSTITEKNIEDIVQKLKKISNHEILSISFGIDGEYRITTCSSGARILYYCDGGESFKYDLESKTIINADDPERWIQ